ncbi:DUF998 domain-containing protein [Luteimonas sp. MC1825]|uniref:DUF998 domain-containing protein n=1 Tax=Luteimonas sp. MC1825 TaxID=2761107 RepID=UPI00160C8D3B|nr:DUF998 domain-containing protein [Luteimonas sp. MC1825]MBB6598033.1 DUF998 domain-containing protein [Luteimonas sp. MC1825]QOC88272.1 DUF998 domain-containing protein [Luteimonas sp. MC1825]
MNRVKLARMLAVCVVLFGLAFYAVGATIKPGYSSVSHFISELNAAGTAWAQELGYFGFIPLGILFGAFLWAAGPHAQVRGVSRLGWFLLWAQPLTLVAVAFAPCDAGCPLEGSASQELHNLQGVVAYFASGLGLILLSFAPPLADSPAYRRYFLRLAGAAFAIFFVLMLSPDVASIRGALQRTADAFLALSLLLIAWHVVRQDAQVTPNNSFKPTPLRGAA